MNEDLVNGGSKIPRRTIWSNLPGRLFATSVIVILWLMFANWWTNPGEKCYCDPDAKVCLCKEESGCRCFPKHSFSAPASTRFWVAFAGSVIWGSLFFFGWDSGWASGKSTGGFGSED